VLVRIEHDHGIGQRIRGIRISQALIIATHNRGVSTSTLTR
jgi:hypothetical protein